MRCFTFIVTAASLLATAACSQPSPTGPAPGTRTIAVLGQTASLPVVADSHEEGTKRAEIEITAPKEGGYLSHRNYGVLALSHHWVANDIFLYTATLKSWNGTAYVAIGSGISTTVNPKAVPAQTKAVFTNLKQGTKYQVDIVASGNNGGTAGTTTLNAAAPTDAVYDFTGAQDVQDTLTSSVAITFDAVAFSGTGTTTMTAPADGIYANPTSAEAGSAL
jgi:hypothetical protein